MKLSVRFLPLALAISLAAYAAHSTACASMTQLQVAQVSHDALATLQDTEAGLCWGVPNVAAAIAANVTPNHCLSAAAAAVGLTDARHQEFNAKLKIAIDTHKTATALLASGAANVDMSAFRKAIQDVAALIAQLTQSNSTVASMTLSVQKAGK